MKLIYFSANCTMRATPFILLIALSLAFNTTARAQEPTPADETELQPIWPLSGTAEPDADPASAPYGPRWIGRYDFHAGIDLPAPTGTPIKAVLPGRVVQVRPWDGVTRGPGNSVLLRHDADRFTTYLHLDTIAVEEGEELEQGDILGTVGDTGATYPHLHFAYSIGLQDRVDERRTRNPLELLPHDPPRQLRPARFEDEHTIVLQVPVQTMTIQSITLIDTDEQRKIDYYEIVARGWTPRKEPVQDGIHLSTARASDGHFPLTLRLEPADFTVRRVVVTDIHGETILDQTRN